MHGFVAGRQMIAALAVLSLALASPQATPPQTGEPDIVGLWSGTATTGAQSADVGFDIRKGTQGLALFMTLPRLHAWRMPIAYLQPADGGGWAIPDWKITLRRDGDRLTGTLGDPRVTFRVARVEALTEETPVPAYPPGPEPQWRYDAGAPLWASPAVRGGIAYVADASGTVHAVRAADGSRAWTARLESPVYGAPVATDAAVFVFDDGGRLHRLDRATGRVMWRADLGSDPAARVLPAATVFDFDFHAPTPVLTDGVIHLASAQGVVHAIDAESGRIRWRTDLGARIRASAAVSPAHVFVGTLENDVVALDRATGRERWRWKAAGPITTAPVLAGRLVLVASRGSWITALDAATGAEVWSRYDWFSWIESTGVVADGVFYVGSSDLRAVRALEPGTGRPLWETDVLGWAWGTPAVTADTIYVGVAGPQKYVTKHAAGLVALDRRSGAVRWRRPVAAHATNFVSGYPGSVVVAEGMLIAPDVKGVLEGYRIR
jgi:outer membrane protein assembly factor BamB